MQNKYRSRHNYHPSVPHNILSSVDKPFTNQFFPATAAGVDQELDREADRSVCVEHARREAAMSSSMDSSELRKVFQMFDKNGDGQITKKELGESLKNLGIYIPEEELDATMDKIDVNGDGCVDVEEFGKLYRSIVDDGPGADGDKHDEEEDMREAFNVFDQNGDGYITVEELRSVLSSLGLKQGRTAEDCRKMISKVDADGDGRVDFTEFKQMMRGGGFAALGT